jgi:ketosteroid isomerase-like protein
MAVTGSDRARVSLPAPDDASAVDLMYQALADGDVDAARACCTDDLVVWHAYDQREQLLDDVVAGWRAMIAAFPERAFVDVRRSQVPGGWVQRQLLVARTPSGDRVAWPLCLFVAVRDGRVARVEEYIDRAGRYTPEAHESTTRGLPPGRPDAVL